jgi:hypothetical protein
MNPLQACKTTLKEIKALLASHPDNAWLKKWRNRFTATLKEVKSEGYPVDFERFWKAYPRTRGTSKAQAYGNWGLICPDAEMAEFLAVAAVQYGKDCKKSDMTIAHPATWLSPTEKRWESYEGLRVQVEEKATCYICKEQPVFEKITIDMGDGCVMMGVCFQCKKYDMKTVKEIKADRLKGK